MIEGYLLNRPHLRGLVVIMDSRRPMMEHDVQMLDWCGHRALPTHILLNKTDKLKQNEIAKSLNATRKMLQQYSNEISCQTFSASKGTGLPQLRAKLLEWLAVENPASE